VELETLSLKIARSENLPVLPQIVSAVLKLADDPNSTARDMEKLVEREPAIAAKVLRVANSAYYGGQKVSSVGRAISLLGMMNIRALVVGVAFQQVINEKQNSQNFCKLTLWRHSMAVSTAARILGKMKSPHLAEELYTAGMMHDLGLLVLDRFYPVYLDEAVKMAQSDGIELHLAEQHLFGFDHSHIGGILAERWNFSPIIKHAIRYHHSPAEDEEHFDTTCFIVAANVLAQQCDYHNQVKVEAPQIPIEAFEAVGIPEEQYDAIRAVLKVEVAKIEEVYQF
jgi:HD-like signal output (HDOD) protein